jgi:hypothetical protein
LHSNQRLRNQASGCKHVVLNLVDREIKCAGEKNSLFLKESVINDHCFGAELCDELHQTIGGDLIHWRSKWDDYFAADCWVLVSTDVHGVIQTVSVVSGDVMLFGHLPSEVCVKVVAYGSEHKVTSRHSDLGVGIDRLINAFDDLGRRCDVLFRLIIHVSLAKYHIQRRL